MPKGPQWKIVYSREFEDSIAGLELKYKQRKILYGLIKELEYEPNVRQGKKIRKLTRASEPDLWRIRTLKGTASEYRIFYKVFESELKVLIYDIKLRDDAYTDKVLFPESLKVKYGGRSSVGRALDCGSSGRGFEPHRPPQYPILEELNKRICNCHRLKKFMLRLPLCIGICRRHRNFGGLCCETTVVAKSGSSMKTILQ